MLTAVLTPFELMVIFRIQVTDRDLRRKYLAVEAVMEDLAPRLEVDVDTARLAGLGVGMDAQLCRENGARRGAMAVELLGTDRAPQAVLDAVAACRSAATDSLSPLAAGLFAAEALVLEAWELLSPDAAAGDSELDGAANTLDTLDTLEPVDLVARLRRRARVRGDQTAQRTLDCAERIEIAPDELAGQTLSAMRRIRSDLAL